MKKVFDVNRRLSLLMFSALIGLAACSKDDDGNAEVQQIVGDYALQDTDEYDDTDTYSITISKSGKESDLEISNFGNIMYVPVKANLKNGIFTIPAQTFEGKNMNITLSGQGNIDNGMLTFDYVIETNDDYILEHSCIATKPL